MCSSPSTTTLSWGASFPLLLAQWELPLGCIIPRGFPGYKCKLALFTRNVVMARSRLEVIVASKVEKTSFIQERNFSKKKVNFRENENENILSKLVERQVLWLTVEVNVQYYQFISSNLTHQRCFNKRKTRFLVTFFLIWLHWSCKVNQQQVNWTKDHQYKTHCRFVNEHGEESRLFRAFFLSALQNASARKSNLCANEDFSRALNVTIEFSKRVLLFDWLFRPPFRLNLSAQSRSLTTASRHKKKTTLPWYAVATYLRSRKLFLEG